MSAPTNKTQIVKGSECAFAENSWLRVNHGKLDSSGNLQARFGGVDVGTFGRTTINRGVKAILKVEIRDDKEKKEVMKSVSDLSGVDSISMDMKDKKMTVIGDIDPVNIVNKQGKLCHTEIVYVGTAKEPEKKKEEVKKKEDDKKNTLRLPPRRGAVKIKPFSGILKVDTSYNPRMPSYPPPKSADDDTSGCACVIL